MTKNPEMGPPAQDIKCEVGQTVVYHGRAYQIKSIEGDEAEIFAPESTLDIPDKMKVFDPNDVAKPYEGRLSADQKSITAPEQRMRVKLTDLKEI